MLLIVCGAMVYLSYNLPKHSSGFSDELTRWIWTVMVFMIGLLGRNALNVLWEQRLYVANEAFSFHGKPHILVYNMNYGNLIDMKVSFELVELLKDVHAPTSARINLVETISLSSMPARRGKTGFGMLYIEVPDKILERWRNSASDSECRLIVRGTSVHPFSNFRAVTNTAIFESPNAFDVSFAKHRETSKRDAIEVTDTVDRKSCLQCATASTLSKTITP
ncbi:MAG: hypothetical protein JOY65_02170 [Acetobacteraceae bacterium]|nr:hypothetical protein [Acetobacteraceae bacterium]